MIDREKFSSILSSFILLFLLCEKNFTLKKNMPCFYEYK